MTAYVIYGLTHPCTGEVWYVGKSKHLATRRRYSCTLRVGKWVRALKAKGLRPTRVELETGVGSDWGDRERYWIRSLRATGSPLLNICAGGNGSHAREGLSEEFVGLLGKIPDGHIAEKAGLTREAIRYHRQSRDIPAAKRNTRRPSATQFQKGLTPFNRLVRLDKALSQLGQCSDAEIADRFGVQRSTVARRRKALGVPACRGVRHRGKGNAKVSIQDVLDIRNRGSYSEDVLAEQYGISVSAVHRIITRVSWAHIP